MKYLKKIFEGKTMLDTNNLGDILQEITDLGYLSNVKTDWWSADDRGNDISICIYGKDEYDKQFGCEVAYIYPDDIIEVIERLIRYLGDEGYSLGINHKKEVEAIKNRPTTKTKDEIKIIISKFNPFIFKSLSNINELTMRWDDKSNGYKVCYSLSLDFRQS